MGTVRVLLLAEPALGLALGEALRVHGFRVEATSAADAALALAGGLGFDVAVVDRAALGARPGPVFGRLQKLVGAPFCLLDRARGGAKLPAEATLAKPVRVQLLAATVRALAAAGGPPRVGAFVFHAADRLLVDKAGHREIRLTETESGLLDGLLRARGEALARQDLLRAVWGYNAKVTTRTLETHVYRLRQKIERDPARARVLLTVPGGYRLVTRAKDGKR
jgi:DNA-binding response OmpR family regulator